MAVKVRQQSFIHQPSAPFEPEKQPNQQSKKVRKTTYGISGREKVLILVLALLIVGLAVISLKIQSDIHTTNMEIKTLENEVTQISNENVDLKVQVGELSTYERIWEKAQELGLTLNEKNVKVVPNE